MPNYKFTRSAIIQETYMVKAIHQDDAWEKIRNSSDPKAEYLVQSEFVDWYTDDFHLEAVHMILDPLPHHRETR